MAGEQPQNGRMIKPCLNGGNCMNASCKYDHPANPRRAPCNKGKYCPNISNGNCQFEHLCFYGDFRCEKHKTGTCKFMHTRPFIHQFPNNYKKTVNNGPRQYIRYQPNKYEKKERKPNENIMVEGMTNEEMMQQLLQAIQVLQASKEIETAQLNQTLQAMNALLGGNEHKSISEEKDEEKEEEKKE